MEDKYSFFKRLQLCVIKKSFGKTIILESLGTAIKYFMVFMIIIASITMIQFTYSFKLGLEEAMQTIQKEIPEFKLANGYLECQGEMPIIEVEGNSVFVLDTSGKVDESILNSYDEGIVITSTKVFQKKNSIEYTTYNFKDIDWIKLTKGDVLKFIDKWYIPALFGVFIVGMIFILIAKLINVVFISILALIVNAFIRTKLIYENLFKLSFYAITLSTIIKMIITLFDLNVPYFFLIYYGVTIYYLYRYLSEVKKDLALPLTDEIADGISEEKIENA